MKCDQCEKLAELRRKIDKLEGRCQALIDGEQIQKIHFAIDDQRTACGIDISEFFMDTVEDIRETTCKVCRAKWAKMKKAWEKEK